MIKYIFLVSLLFSILLVNPAHAQNKVVVIPLFGDDAASKWLGPWTTDTAYKKSDIIEFGGSSYIALSDHQSDLSNIPPDDSFWDLVAAAGANGMDGSAADAVAAICVALGSTAGCNLPAVILAALPRYAIGDTGPAGGIVFYITDGGLHGMEAAPADSADSVWGCLGTSIGTSTDIHTGATNTAAIVAGCTSAEVTAAEVANDYELNGFTWFLPSKEELNQLYLQQDVVGGFASFFYWSSSEASIDTAWLQAIGDGRQSGGGKAGSTGVRAVRAF